MFRVYIEKQYDGCFVVVEVDDKNQIIDFDICFTREEIEELVTVFKNRDGAVLTE